MISCRRFCRVAVFAAALIIGGNLGFAEDEDVTLGAKRMAARIDTILKEQNPLHAAFRNAERAKALEQIVKQLEQQAPNSPDHLSALFNLALELLRAGEMEDSLRRLDEMRDLYAAAPGLATPGKLNASRTVEALDYLRIGEVENCFA